MKLHPFLFPSLALCFLAADTCSAMGGFRSKKTNHRSRLLQLSPETKLHFLQETEMQFHHRHLFSSSCSFASIGSEDCTLFDFCNQLNNDGNSLVECQGLSMQTEEEQEWQLKSSSEEMCFYWNDQVGGLFDASRFDATKDFCAQSTASFHLIGTTPRQSELVYEITRPVKGSLAISNDLELCSAATSTANVVTETIHAALTDSTVFEGYCATSCSHVTLNGKTCDHSCCEEPSQGADCSNLFSSMASCGGGIDDLYAQLSEYTGAVCSWQALLEGRCGLDSFCAQLQILSNQNASQQQPVCVGDIKSQWSIAWTYPTLCFVHSNDEYGVPYSEQTAANSAFCQATGSVLHFVQGTLVQEQAFWEITEPTRGRFVDSYALSPCDSTDAEPAYSFGGVDYCADPCPGISTINGETCRESCGTCPNGQTILDCSNVDSSLVQRCSAQQGDLTLDLLEHFQKANDAATSPEPASDAILVYTTNKAMMLSMVVALVCTICFSW